MKKIELLVETMQTIVETVDMMPRKPMSLSQRILHNQLSKKLDKIVDDFPEIKDKEVKTRLEDILVDMETLKKSMCDA